MKSNVQEFVGLLFASRDYAHKSHLNTESYAQHKALESFYDEIVDLADTFAETWMGRNLTKIGEIPVITPPKGEPLTVIQRFLQVLIDTRDFVNKDSVLSNIIDEIEALYLRTIYKLKFLE